MADKANNQPAETLGSMGDCGIGWFDPATPDRSDYRFDVGHELPMLINHNAKKLRTS